MGKTKTFPVKLDHSVNDDTTVMATGPGSDAEKPRPVSAPTHDHAEILPKNHGSAKFVLPDKVA